VDPARADAQGMDPTSAHPDDDLRPRRTSRQRVLDATRRALGAQTAGNRRAAPVEREGETPDDRPSPRTGPTSW
jgi:hypothetical protein